MKIGIIGAGFSGLASAYYLAKKSHEVTVFEKDPQPGGLAVGFKNPKWEWSLEHHYHHFFTNDKAILTLCKEVNHQVIISRPKTSVYVNEKLYQLDSPMSVLRFSHLSPLNRFRMAASLAFLRYNPFWKMLENYHAIPYLKKSMGQTAYSLLWEPQLNGKFGDYKKDISLAWFWARIKKRTASLAYPKGGFLSLAKTIETNTKKRGGKFHYNSQIILLEVVNNKVQLITKTGDKVQKHIFDKAIVTLPTPLFFKIAKKLPDQYISRYQKLTGIGAINLILRLSKKLMTDDTYWLSVCDSNPLMAVVEHTNFMDKKNFNNEHIVYLGKYAAPTDPFFQKSKEELLEEYDPILKRINPEYKKNILSIEIFKAPFAQPIIPPNYSQMIPPFKTPLKNVYLANIQQVYPWDRGTNYAVELGKKVAEMIDKK